MAFINESDIEQSDIDLFTLLGFKPLDGWKDKLLGRESLRDVVLKDRLLAALQGLNPDLPTSCIDSAVDALTADYPYKPEDLVEANKAVYALLREGVPVSYMNAEQEKVQDYVQVLDFADPQNNDFCVVSQLTIKCFEKHKTHRRPDLLLYVNGLPLVMLELKNATVSVKSGYDVNLVNYVNDIPQLFWFNMFVGISNGIQTRLGSFSAPWEHFFSWTRKYDPTVDHEQLGLEELEKQSEATGNKLSLQYLCEGLCNKDTLLDYFENFVLFDKKSKIVAKNHQYLGVNNAVLALKNREDNEGKLGVFWHTQGSGKSYSMIMFTRKVRRKIEGNWSFLVVTDRMDLDDQIFRNFKDTETIALQSGQEDHRNEYRAKGYKSRMQLREALTTNKSFYFSTIFNFGIDKGKTFPLLSERDDWVVIVDEAHRSQYKTYGENMRLALPNAQYVAFTGTPLLKKDKTNEWFGPYVSEYNFAQSIEDGATVPLYYKKNVPKVEQVNEDLVGEAAEILAEENISEEQQRKLDNEYSTLFSVVKRPDRLDEIAKHIVKHFPYRLDVEDEEGQRKPMKAMVVSIDKFTAALMYQKVKDYCAVEIRELRVQQRKARDSKVKQRCARAIKFVQETKMALVVSLEGTEKDEEKKFQQKIGFDIKPHRKLMDYNDEDGRNIEDYFKDPNDPHRIVFVTAMWMTGFDAPAVSTMYLDKPLQNHTLMQTIARANRVFEGKKNGLIVDYFGVFRNLRKALADYAEGSKDKDDEEDFPIQEFEEIFVLLEAAMQEISTFCLTLDVDLQAILDIGEKSFKEVELFKQYAENLLLDDKTRKQFNLYVNVIKGLYDSAKPDIYAHPEKRRFRDMVEYLRKVVERQIDGSENLVRARERIDEMLDSSVVSQGDLLKTKYAIKEGKLVYLHKLDFGLLREEFKKTAYKHTQFTDLRDLVEAKLKQMVAQNKSRGPFLGKFEKIIEEYNLGSLSLEEAYEETMTLFESLGEEEKRSTRLNMTEEELEIFDLLKKDKLTKAEQKEVRLAAIHLLKHLREAKHQVFVQEWHKRRRTQEVVRQEIRVTLNKYLPEPTYGLEEFTKKSDGVFQHFFDNAYKGEQREWLQ